MPGSWRFWLVPFSWLGEAFRRFFSSAFVVQIVTGHCRGPVTGLQLSRNDHVGLSWNDVTVMSWGSHRVPQGSVWRRVGSQVHR